ncbi:MAG: tetratricopeptide repeat protein [Thiolinea sp.]
MSRLHVPHRFVGLSLALVIAGCTVGTQSYAEPPAALSALAGPLLPKEPFQSETSYQLYNTLVAEMLIRQGKIKQAAQHYVLAVGQSKDKGLAKRATETAIQAGEPVLAKAALDQWAALEPDTVEVHQYRLLVNAQLGNYDATVDDAIWVRDYIEKKEGHGFEYVVSLLALDAGPANAYEVIKRYAAKVENTAKTQLVLATFALSANKPEAVLEGTDSVQKTGDTAQKEEAVRLRAKALLSLDRVSEALSTLEPHAKNSKNQDLRLEYGRMLIMADRRDDARPIYKQLYAEQPENADILYTLGLLSLEQEEFAYAESLLKKLLEIPERRYEANYFLGQVYEGQKRVDEALAAYEEALNGDFARDAIGRKSALLHKAKGLAEAQVWLDSLLDKATMPEQKVTALMAKGQLLHDAGEYQQAIDTFNKAEEFGSKKRDILYARALSYDRMGNVAQAEKDLREVVALDPKDADALNALGYMLAVSTTRYQDAYDLIKQALDLRPDSPAVMDSMGWIMFKKGDAKGAEEWLVKAYDKMPDPEIAAHLIEVLSVNGKRNEARKLFKEMIAKYPDDKQLADVKQRVADLADKSN